MGEADLAPKGGYHPKPVDPKRIQKIKEGGRRADEIRKKADEHHHKTEVPVADKQLMEELKKINS